MHDLTPGEERHGPSRAVLPGTWFFRYSQWLVARRPGFRALAWAAVVNFVLFGLFLAFATPMYETNDDLMMQLIASGFYTGHPDPHLVFTNVIIGWVLRFLYGTWTGCNWYLGYLLVAHYAALTAVAFLVVSRRGGWLFTMLYLGFFLIVETHLLLRLQFTTTAFLVGTAGLLLLVDALQPGHPADGPRLITGLAFWGLMCLIREPVALLLAAVACPFVVERLGLTQWRRLLATVLAFVAIFLVLHETNSWVYQRDPAWAEFSNYNRVRGEIQITELSAYLPQADSAVGWSKNDGWMFSEFYFPDPDVYAGANRMHLLLDKLKTLARHEPMAWWSFSTASLYLPKVFQHDAGILMQLAILNALWCLFAAGTLRRRFLVTLLISYALYVVFCFHLQTTARLPERVAYNIPLFVHAICLYWATGFYLAVTTKRSGPPGVVVDRLRRSMKLRGMASLAGSVWTGWAQRLLRYRRALTFVLVPAWVVLYLTSLSGLAENLWLENTSNRNLEGISRKILEPIRTLLPAQQTPLLIAMPLDSTLEQCLCFYPSVKSIPFSMVPYGWITHSPLFYQILERNRLRPYSRSLVDRPDVFFLMETRWLRPLRIFYSEHYGLDIRFDMVLNTDGMPPFKNCRLYLYQAHSVRAKTPPATAPR